MSSPATTPPADRLSRRSLAAYGAGIVAYQFPNGALAALAMPLFNIVYGLPAVAVGAVLMFGRIWDALSNPLMGALSDATRSRWGRRRPYLVAGALLTGALYPAIWLAPRHASHAAVTGYLGASVFFLFTAFAAFSVPYIALGFELTPDVHERTRVQVWRGYFNVLPTFAIGWLFWLCQRPIFADPAIGARWVGLACGLVIALTGIIPGIALRERYYPLSAHAVREPIGTAFRAALRNGPFVVILAMIVTLIIGTQSTDALGIYLLTYYVYPHHASAAARMLGFGSSVAMIVGVAVLPVLQAVERRIGKVGTLRLCILVNMAADLSKWILVSPRHAWTWTVVVAFTQFGGIGFWVLVASMKADVCDWDELRSGRRREGAYGAVANLVQKLATSSVYLIAGILLQLVGLRTALAATQQPATLLGLRMSFSILPLAALTLCLWLLGKYPLTEERMAQVRTELELRRATV